MQGARRRVTTHQGASYKAQQNRAIYDRHSRSEQLLDRIPKKSCLALGIAVRGKDFMSLCISNNRHKPGRIAHRKSLGSEDAFAVVAIFI